MRDDDSQAEPAPWAAGVVTDRRGVLGRAARSIARSTWTHLVACLVLLALMQAFVVKPYAVPSASMEPTVVTGDRILVDRRAYAGAEPEPADVVVFDEPAAWRGGEVEDRGVLRTLAGVVGDTVGFGPSNHHAVVKRVVATAGAEITRGDDPRTLLVDGRPLAADPAASSVPSEGGCAPAEACAPFVVPAGMLLVAGDNRAVSSDSFSPCVQDVTAPLGDCLRLVPTTLVVGRAVWVLLPFSRWGGIA